MGISVRKLAVHEPSGLKTFLELPRAVYRNDPHHCAPFRDSVIASLGREEFRGRQEAMIALDGGRTVARLVARTSPVLQDAAGKPLGMLGFFEALEHPDAVRRLFQEGVNWLKQSGVGTIIGPMDGDTWHSYRLNVGPTDDRPFMMEPYNPPYYTALWERNGFGVLKRYYSMQVSDLDGVIGRLEPKAQAVLDEGYRLERLRADSFEDELRRLWELSCNIFRGNYLYADITRERFVGLYAGARSLVDADLVCFAVAPDGTDAGFLFAVPDYARAVTAMRGSRGLWAKLRFLALRRRAEAVNLKSLGVVPEHRRSGLGAALMHHGYKSTRDKGYRKANLCLMLDDNPSGRLAAGLGRLLRHYHLFQWSGESAT